MKKLILAAVLCLSAFAASAQYVEGYDQNVRLKGSRVFVDGEKIPNGEVLAYLTAACNESTADAWNRNRNAYKTGLGLTIAGSTLEFLGGMSMVCGIMAAAIGGMYLPILGAGAIISGDYDGVTEVTDAIFLSAETLASVGGYTALAGLAMIASGIPVMCVYKKKLNTMFQEYAPGLTSEVNLTFGPTANGIGLALNF